MTADHAFADFVNLADPQLGAAAIACSDDFFAPMARMLSPEPAIFYPGRYDDHGKWMDGWETRRRRNGGHDWCVVKLARPGRIRGIDIDTSHFTGNYPPAAGLEACNVAGEPDAATAWHEILPATALGPSAHHLLAIADARSWSHVRLNILPDGGVARLRIFGEITRTDVKAGEEINLIGIESGGHMIDCSDRHYGSPNKLLYPGRGADMGDGWETRRRREPGNDWAIFALGMRGRVVRIEIDTAHFKGNYPDRCSILAADMAGGTRQSLVTQSMFWPTLLTEQKMEMDQQHFFTTGIADLGPVTHIRLNLFPDGGISRLRLWGRPA